MICFRIIYFILCSILILGTSATTHALSIAEKKAGILPFNQDMSPELQQLLMEINRDLANAQSSLEDLYRQVNSLYQENAPAEAYQDLLHKINLARQEIIALETHWREIAVADGNPETYALWNQPETTIGELIMDYGSQAYVYIVPSEIDGLKLSVNSNLPIPRASWEELLDLILTQNGIGYRQLNPFLRQLYFLKDNQSGLKLITNNPHDLELFPLDARICFVLTPEPAEVRRAWMFLDKFVNPNSTVLQMLGRDILIIGQVGEVLDLLKLYAFIAANKGDKEYKVFPIRRIDAEEMARILGTIFDHRQGSEEGMRDLPSMLEKQMNPKDRSKTKSPMQPPKDNGDANGLKIIALSNVANALFLVGTKEEIKKAEQIIHQVEDQVGEARERVIYWYTAKNSDPEELAEILQKIYFLLLRSNPRMGENGPPGGPLELYPVPTSESIANDIIEKEIRMLPSELYQTSYYQQGNYIVNPSPIEPRRTSATPVDKSRENFIVDQKTGSIAMVVESDLLPKLKDLIKKLDVPKRMVQIEVLLFERRITKNNNYGLNLLKIGDCAKNIDSSCFDWTTNPIGILNLFLSRSKTCNLPAYDIAYSFLMSQDDIQINASPSVVAVNQTTASIAVVEEISMNTGIYIVETAKGNTLERAFTRAQYGITINMTPTIHITEDEESEADETNYVTLETDITFDTFQLGDDPERPDVTRRNIQNEVRVPDGQTIILGGLRRKLTDNFKDGIPFFSEIPAFGKLFGQTEYQDIESEMFIFLTPTIISDPLNDFERIKCAEMKRRPGDIPEFVCALYAAREMERNRVMVNSMIILLGPEPDRCHTPSYWRPSTCAECTPEPSFVEAQWNIQYLPPTGEYDGR